MYSLRKTLILRKTIMFLVSLSISSLRAEESLFLNSDDSQKALSLAKVSQSEKFKVSGIFYINQSEWIVWINGRAYNSIGQKERFSLDEVFEDSITLTNSEGNTFNLSVE